MTLKTYHIETFGCQMNKNDSELMGLSMNEHGFIQAETASCADIVIFNTCSVRKHAEDRVKSRIGAVKYDIRSRNGLIVIAGCMAQRIGSAILDDAIADIVVGPYQAPKVGEIVKLHLGHKGAALFNSLKRDDFSSRINPGLASMKNEHPWHRWVTITHGCENFCSYCIVPYVRGKLISFKSDSIIEYIKICVEAGVREITLLGQNVNQYGTDTGDIPFHTLLEKTAGIQGIVRINFITSHPKDFNQEIIRVIRDNPAISRSIHLPLQSGSDAVLKKMNRNYTMKHYMEIVQVIEKTLDEFSLTTDLIVGYPGESAADFQTTLDAVRSIRFDEAYTYAYSPREGTPAYSLTEEILHGEKIARLNELISLQRKISREKLAARIGHIEQTIIEQISKKSSSEVLGKTFLNHPVILAGTIGDIGNVISVKIDGVKGSMLRGTRVA